MSADFPALGVIPKSVVICDQFGLPLRQLPDALITGGVTVNDAAQ